VRTSADLPVPAAAPARSPAAQRIVDAAMDLFAERGYAATTVAEIERAAGLTPRASGMYRHFASKQAVLEAGLADQVDAMATLHAVDESALDDLDLREWLTLLGGVGIERMAEQRALIRLLYRDLDPFPALVESLTEGLVRAGYRDFAARLRVRQRAGDVRADLDVDAVAAVAIGSVVNRGVLMAMLGEPPAGVEDERFLATWVDAVARMVQP
jgi:AcrR family transcriptional regulator